jgi:hypothetical protein
MPVPALNKNSLDVAQIFQTYMLFAGDVERVALACDVDRVHVQQLAHCENWAAKVADMERLRGENADAQIQLNRGVNYVQAHRLHSILDKVIGHLSLKSAEDIVDLCTKVGKGGETEFSARALTDLVKAAESCQVMTQRALGDTAAERPEASEAKGKGSQVALNVMAAMNVADKSGLDSVSLVRQQLGAPARALPAPNDNE